MSPSAELAGLYRKPGTFEALGVVIVNLLIITIITLVDWQNRGCFLAILATIVLATRFKALNNILHECSHLSFHRRRGWNELIGKALAALLFQDFGAYKAEHMSHHRFLGDYARDRDFGTIQNLEPHLRPEARTVVRNLWHPDFRRAYIPCISGGSAAAGKAVLASVLLWQLVRGCPVNAVVLAAAFFGLYPMLKYLTDLVDHGGIYLNRDRYRQTRNFLAVPRVIKWLLFPRNDCYHLIHHLYPGLPVNAFGKAHQVLLRDPNYVHQYIAMNKLN